MKKVTGKHAEKHYTKIDTTTGEVLEERTPEFTRMSRRPGIGNNFFQKFTSDMYPEGNVVTRGGLIGKTPRYYDALREEHHPIEIKNMKIRRQAKAIENKQTYKQLKAAEEISLRKTKQLIRPLEK